MSAPAGGLCHYTAHLDLDLARIRYDRLDWVSLWSASVVSSGCISFANVDPSSCLSSLIGRLMGVPYTSFRGG